ncbi:hypothetical protein KBB96_05075 [Luteolibacter ambystomatis]|uniref:Uncharacterized protein n=1 Tax=Luteolibacter ambystomatis TaxID=2824561 RepID=A0A975J1F4_9BACT|nr:hypothetical protein [Luteolibacter ambystomatis]QUE52265.1 hypothetical protein KBB96_05075 [Luteolibacter ambystomatis]
MHSELNSLKFCYFRPIRLALASAFLALMPTTVIGDEALPYAEHFNPANGFKPAQRNLTAIFLQMAGSFEHYGTPANYLRHANAEAKRVEAAWLKAKGKPAKFRPEYFTEEYIEKLITGWNQMERVLALESFTRTSGRQMRYAIIGSGSMTPAELASLEPNLTAEESAEFRRLVAKPYFTKDDFVSLERFYADGKGHHKLTAIGKEAVNRRVRRGTMDQRELDKDIEASKEGTTILSILSAHQRRTVGGINGTSAAANADDLQTALVKGLKLAEDRVEVDRLPSTERDALTFSHAIKGLLDQRLKEISKQATPEQMKAMKTATTLMFENLIVASQLEFEAGLWDEVLQR